MWKNNFDIKQYSIFLPYDSRSQYHCCDGSCANELMLVYSLPVWSKGNNGCHRLTRFPLVAFGKSCCFSFSSVIIFHFVQWWICTAWCRSSPNKVFPSFHFQLKIDLRTILTDRQPTDPPFRWLDCCWREHLNYSLQKPPESFRLLHFGSHVWYFVFVL